jgi:hypothetical protein
MTQSGYPPTDPGSARNPDPSSPSPLGDQSSWYAQWTPDPSSTPPIAPPPGGQPAAAVSPPDPDAPWGVPGPGAAPQPGPFGVPPDAAGPPLGTYGMPPNATGIPGPPGFGSAPNGQGPYGQGPYGSGPGYRGMGYQGMGYRGWRRGMYGPMGGRQVGAFLRRRAISNITMGAIFLVIGIVITAASYGAVSSSGGVHFAPFGLIIIGALWLFRGVMLLVRSSRLP